jgi:phage shock protein A
MTRPFSTVEADGVALAAIQALYNLVLQKDEQIQKLAQQLEQLRGQVARLQPSSRSSTD